MIAFLRIIAFAALTAIAATGAHSQAGGSDAALDLEEWRDVATAAERTLDRSNAPNDVLETLRARLVGWRERFLGEVNANAARIDTVESQIDALGPVPEEGAEEPPEIAERRAELLLRKAELEAPGLRASEALNEATGLIAEIDLTFRDRQADRFLRQGPYPFNPAIWAEISARLISTLDSMITDFREALADPDRRAEGLASLPRAIALILLGVVLIVTGRRWIENVTTRLDDAAGKPGTLALRFLVSLGQIAIPLFGVGIVYIAVVASRIFGDFSQAIASSIGVFGVVVLAVRWFAVLYFPKGDDAQSLLGLSVHDRNRGRVLETGFGITAGVAISLEYFSDAIGGDADLLGVFLFPVLLLSSFFMFRLGSLLRQRAAEDDGEAGSDQIAAKGLLGNMVAVTGRAAQIVGILAPIAAALGYANLGGGILYSFYWTIALTGVLAALYFVISDVYALIRGISFDAASDSLVPILVTLALFIMSIPLYALILGARWTDIEDAWVGVQQGVNIGEVNLSPETLITLLIVFAIGFLLTRFLQGTLRTTILPKTSLDKGAQSALVAGIGYVGITIAAFAAISTAGLDLSNIALIASALSVGIGFGLQTIVSNFISGVILLIERPISEGDWIEVGTNMGVVKDISVRATTIETFDRRDVIVPNSDLVSGTVTNWTRGNNVGRVIVSVGVGYDSDTQLVEKILREVCEAHPLVVLNPPPAVLFRRFGDNALEFEARCILRDVNFMFAVLSDLNHQILIRFRKENILIPFPQRDVWLRTPGDTKDVKGAQMHQDYVPPKQAPVIREVTRDSDSSPNTIGLDGDQDD